MIIHYKVHNHKSFNWSRNGSPAYYILLFCWFLTKFMLFEFVYILFFYYIVIYCFKAYNILSAVVFVFKSFWFVIYAIILLLIITSSIF
jgi:hypothetical protein